MADRTVPDPGLTLSENVNVMGHLRHVIAQKPYGDTVLFSAWQKLQAAGNAYVREHPEELDAISKELAMQRRLGEDGSERLGG